MKTRLTSLLVLALCAVGSLSAQPRQKQTETKAEKPRLTEEERRLPAISEGNERLSQRK